MATARTLSPAAELARPKQDNVKEVRALIDGWIAALHDKDAGRVMSHGTGDMVQFALAPPLTADNDGPYGLKGWFATWTSPIQYELRDLEIAAGDDVAFSHGLVHMTGTRTDGESTDVWFRSTLGFRKAGGEWKIAHEHESVPFLMDGSDKAALDLKP